MNQLFERHVNDTLVYKRRYCDEIVPVPELNGVQSLCKLLEVLATPQNGVELGEDRDAYSVICKMWFFFWYTQHIYAYAILFYFRDQGTCAYDSKFWLFAKWYTEKSIKLNFLLY